MSGWRISFSVCLTSEAKEEKKMKGEKEAECVREASDSRINL